MTKTQKKQAYSMHVDGLSLTAIAAKLDVPIDDVRALLGEKPKPVKPEPPPVPTGEVGGPCADAADLQRMLHDRLRGGSMHTLALNGFSHDSESARAGIWSDPDRAARQRAGLEPPPRFRPPGGRGIL